MQKPFASVAGNHPSLNRFDLSYTNLTSMSLGYLYPVQCDEVLPNSVWKMKAFCHAELMPLIAPLMSDLQLFAHAFFVPYRLLYGFDAEDGENIWEKFITGGKDGDYATALPNWSPSFTDTGFSSKKIWDYIGNPMSYVAGTGWSPLVPPTNSSLDSSDAQTGIVNDYQLTGLNVSIAPKRAYNLIVNKYYIDENLESELSLDNEDLFRVSFKKDYFTSALEAQQRGTAPALPVDLSGTLPVLFTQTQASNTSSNNNFNNVVLQSGTLGFTPNPYPGIGTTGNYLGLTYSDSAGYSGKPIGSIVSGSVNASNISATTFTPSDLRLAFAIQRMQELSMRAGYRYTEYLHATFNAAPTDARLDRPEYIGGCIMPVNVSPLVQTSGTWDSTAEATAEQTTPQGNKSGIGAIDAIEEIGNYRVLEHGLIMTLVSIRPKPIYQQGINRQWLRQTRFDHYDPSLAFLSEQAVYSAELYVDGTSSDAGIFGYQAHWNEMRCKQNIVTGALREQLDYYGLARKFANRPALNSDFLKIKDSDFKHIWAVQDEDHFVVSWSNIIDAYLPIPSISAPGLIDHVYGGY